MKTTTVIIVNASGRITAQFYQWSFDTVLSSLDPFQMREMNLVERAA